MFIKNVKIFFIDCLITIKSSLSRPNFTLNLHPFYDIHGQKYFCGIAQRAGSGNILHSVGNTVQDNKLIYTESLLHRFLTTWPQMAGILCQVWRR